MRGEHSHGDEAKVFCQLAEGEAKIVHEFLGADVRRPWTMTKSE